MKFNLSFLLRGFAALIIVFILLVAAFQFIPKPSQEAILEATIAAGVEARSTEVANLTGSPNPSQIQRTVNAIVEATINAPTPAPLTSSEGISQGAEGFLAWVWSIIVGVWNFMGFGGIYTQICCCLLPFALVIMGAAADKARPR
jgi:hypothetical protein